MSDPLLLGYYGDDLTGSTDVMEALSLGGARTVLFTRIPDEALRARFADCRAVGLAGTSRSETPAWMDANLRPAFTWLKQLGAAISHYKICSTFDSSPAIGSIGKAIEIGRDVFSQTSIPLVVGAQQLKRYTAFGHLFAAYQDRTYRIDRHPVMSRHPVTPMHDSDLTRHLASQTDLRIGLIDLATLQSPGRTAAVDRLLGGDADVVLFDVASLETQRLVGAELWRTRRPGGTFVAGSSGIEYALMTEWTANGIVPGTASFAPVGSVDRIAAVSGSCSLTTERQIRHALQHGFDGVALDPLELVGDDGENAVLRSVETARASLTAGRSVILYTALGPETDRGGEIATRADGRNRLGRALGDILGALIRQERLSRAVIAGGDTSSHALGQLGVDALTVRMPLPQTPGSPLCVAHSTDQAIDGLEIALKGGQIGTDSYFSFIRDGA